MQCCHLLSVIVLQKGKLVFDGTPAELFAREDLQEKGLDLPAAAEVALALRRAGLDIPIDAITPERVAEYALEAVRKGSNA